MKVVLFFVLFICYANASTIQDMMDREVKIDKTDKIVAIGPGALRLVSYMQLNDKLVGIEKLELSMDLKSAYRATFDENHIKNLTIIGEGGAGKLPNLEVLIELNPDIIFSSFLSLEQIKMIESKTKIPVVALSYGSSYGGDENSKKLQSVKDSLSLIGQIMSKENRANELISFMQRLEEELKTLIAYDTKVYIGGIGYKGARGLLSTESHYPSFELLGLTSSVKSPKIGHIEIATEELLNINPDIVYLDLLGKNLINDELNSKKTLYNTLEAFKNKKVFWLYPYNFYNTNIENIFVNSFLIAYTLDENINYEAKKEEIYTMFLGANGYQKSMRLKSEFE